MNPRKRRAKRVSERYPAHRWLTYSVHDGAVVISRMMNGGREVFDREVAMSERDTALAHEAFRLGVTHARMQMRAALGIGS